MPPAGSSKTSARRFLEVHRARRARRAEAHMHHVVAGRQRDHRVRAAVLLGDAEHPERVGLGRKDAPDEAGGDLRAVARRTGPRARAKPGLRHWPVPASPAAAARPPPGLGGTMAAGAIEGGTMVGAPDGKDEPALGASWRGDGSEDGKVNWAAAVPGHPISPKPGPPTPGPRACRPPRSATPSHSWGAVFDANRGKFKPEVPYVPERRQDFCRALLICRVLATPGRTARSGAHSECPSECPIPLIS